MGLFHHRRFAGYSAFGINQVGCVERCAAGLALIAVCARIVAVRALAGNISVSEKLICLLVIQLHRCFLDELALLVQAAEKLRGCGAMDV